MYVRFRATVAVAVAAAAVASVPASARTCMPPPRVISLSPTSTEVLFAIGAGSRVVAVDDQSNFPASAPRTKLSGFRSNTEAILKYRPDLVVLSGDSNNVVAGLKRAKVAVIVHPPASNLGQAYRQIRELGAITCTARQANQVVVRVRRGLAAAVASAPASSRGATYFHEIDKTGYTATSRTFIGQVYRMFGLKNVADGADTTGGGFPQVSSEAVVASNPQFIFLADAQYGESPATVAARPGWSSVSAVKNGRVVPLSADTSSRWGPRVVQFARSVAAALNRS